MRFNPYEVDKEAFGHLVALSRHLGRGPLDPVVRALTEVRVSQINGCAFCAVLHSDGARRAGVSQERLDELAGWRESDAFSQRERAALALAEEMTRVGDGSRVADTTFATARAALGDDELGALVFAIGLIQLWNVVNVASEIPPRLELPALG